MLQWIPKKNPPNQKKFETRNPKKNSLEKHPRILLETKKQKNPKISMRKTRTILEKLAPKSVKREDEFVNWSTFLMGLQNPQTNHIISRGD